MSSSPSTEHTEQPPSTPSAEHLQLVTGEGATREQWEAAVAAVLRKAGRLADDAPDHEAVALLTRTTLDGIPVHPLGTPDLVADVPDPGLPGQAPYTRGTSVTRPFGGWDIRARFEDPDVEVTREHLAADLDNGVTSVWLVLGAAGIALDDLERVLEPVLLDVAPVVLDAPEDPVGAATRFLDLVRAAGVEPAAGTNLGADPLGARRGQEQATEVVREVAGLATGAGVRALVVDGTRVHDRGASDAQELAWTMAAGAAYLRMLAEAGHDPTTAAGLVEFRYAATVEQFPTIAKLRAARLLWSRVLELSGVEPEHRGQIQHAVTSRPMMTRYDPWVNMLRTTVATFAAGVGGATAVTVLPFDEPLGLPEAFGRRIARNTSSLLVAESHVAAVTDPAGGAQALERLTHDLAEAAWALFGEVEAAGGAAQVLDDGSWDARVAATVAERRSRIARRVRPVTGVTEFPHAGEQLPQRRPYPVAPDVVRYAEDFEALRDDPAPTPVFVATLGRVAEHTARATFVANLLAAGGIPVEQAGATADVGEVLAGYTGQKVVFLAGTDAAYRERGAETVEALRGAGAEWVVLAGRPVDGVPVDDHAAAGLDALDFLHRTRARLRSGAPTTEDQS